MKTIVLVLALGALVGIAGYTFYYGRGASYLTDDPTACLNCHIMRDVFERWSHSSHKAVANCNNCHIPKGFVKKWFVKGLNGFNHSRRFLTGNFEEVIRITEFNRQVVERNCISCHQMLLSEVHKSGAGQELSCIMCHPNKGHEK